MVKDIDFKKRYNNMEDYKYALYKAYINNIFPQYNDDIKELFLITKE